MNEPIRAALCIAAVACMASNAAIAQVKQDGQWRGTAGAGLAVTSGNSDTSTLNLKADMARATSADKLTLAGSYDYARSTSNGVESTTANRWNALGQYDYNLSPRIFVFGKLGLEADKLINLNWRASTAGGAGYKLVDTATTSFNVFGGVGYSRDKYDVPQTIRGRTGTEFSRASLLLGEESSHQLTSSTSFKQRLEVSPGVSGDKAVLAKLTSGLSVAINRTLALTVGLVADYNSRPPIGKGTTDTSVFTGLSFKLGAN